MKQLFLFLLLFNFVNCEAHKKLLVLIIASDEKPVYLQEQALWRSYMHYNPDEVEAYFIKGDPNLKSEFEFDGDIIWSRTAETIAPGVLNKTVLSLEAMLPRLDEFDFILRTNLSAFYNFPKMLKYMEKLPKTNCYAGYIFHWNNLKAKGWPNKWVHGFGYVISPDIAKLILSHKNILIDSPIPDDTLIGGLLLTQGIPITEYKVWPIGSMKQWNLTKHSLPEDVFQFRLKQWNPTRRKIDEPIIMQELIEKFYPGAL